MGKVKGAWTLLVVVFVAFGLSGCYTENPRAEAANQAVPVPDAVGDTFRERKQIVLRDAMSNCADFVMFAYRLNDAGAVINQWTCQGLPVSSTESVEPNEAVPSGGSVGIDAGDLGGTRIYSPEMMGLDGTYGDPVPFMYCITPAGHLKHWNYNADVDLSSVPNVYGNTGTTVDEQQLAKKLIAEQTLRDGGCIDDSLNPISCDEVQLNLNGVVGTPEVVEPTATPEGN